MNKGVVLTVLMGLMAASCSQDRVLVQQQDAPISFRTVMDRQTKATSYTAANLSSFNVTAIKGSSAYIEGADFSTDDYAVWTSAQDYFWPESGNLDFYAYAPKAASGNGITRTDHKTFTVVPLADTDNQKDLVFARATGSKATGGATGQMLNFRHAMSQVQIKVSNSNENFRVSVGGWRLAGLDGEAIFTYSGTDTGSPGTFDRSLWSGNTDASSAAVAYTRELTGADAFTFEGTATGAQARTLAGSAIVIPQQTTACQGYSSATVGAMLTGSYIAVYLSIEGISDNTQYITNTWCCWPVVFDLQPGYRYVYSIDLAEGGYSETAPDNNSDPNATLGTKISFASVSATSWGDAASIPLSMNYLTFSTVNPNESNSLSINKGTSNSGVSALEYSTNTTDWMPLNYNTPVTFGNGTDLYIRGTGFSSSTSFYIPNASYSERRYFKFSSDDVKVNCSGDISSLIDYSEGPILTLQGGGRFAHLFQNCKCLVSAPTLPAQELSGSCYEYMFKGCTSLETAPALPATVLNSYCYAYMFDGCTSLETAPELPATVMNTWAYNGMFKGCTSLAELPALPATTLQEGCYANMFQGCTGLVSAKLPYDYLYSATALAKSCYSGMFQGCTNLTSIPADFLPFNTLSASCYKEMFSGCTNLNSIPSDLLSASNLAVGCYEKMFSYCTSLQQAPALPATALAVECYNHMFSDCYALTQAPALPALDLTGANRCYYWMFASCKALATAPALPATTLSQSCYAYMFYGCSNLANVPSTLPATTLGKDCYDHMFCYCVNLDHSPVLPATDLVEGCYLNMFEHTGIVTPPLLNASVMAKKCYFQMFMDCASLTSAPVLGSTSLAEDCYGFMFRGCESLVTPPDLPATTLADGCYLGMFQYCDLLASAPDLNAQVMKDNCYTSMFAYCPELTAVPVMHGNVLDYYCFCSMFEGCSGITTVPADYLPASTLATGCYSSMFKGCSSLTAAPDLPSTSTEDYCYEQMFNGCTNLTAAPDLMFEGKLGIRAYYEMFQGCSNLQGVTALFTEYSYSYMPESSQDYANSECVKDWLQGAGTAYIAGGGTPVFKYNHDLDGNASELVSNGWIVQEYVAPAP